MPKFKQHNKAAHRHVTPALGFGAGFLMRQKSDRRRERRAASQIPQGSPSSNVQVNHKGFPARLSVVAIAPGSAAPPHPLMLEEGMIDSPPSGEKDY